MKVLSIYCLLLLCFLTFFQKMALAQSISKKETKTFAAGEVPIIYSSDIFIPPDDPDDHFDLSAISCIKELNLKAMVFDMSSPKRKPDEVAVASLKQLNLITGIPLPPYATGLREPLRSPDDKALEQPKEFQGGVELVLSTLRKSNEKVVLFLVGSCRDFAVAFNREPELMLQKVKSVYVNAGNGAAEMQTEWNAELDQLAYKSLMSSGLPVYWCPCLPDSLRCNSPEEVIAGKAYSTYYIIYNQAEILDSSSKELVNYFAYALNRSIEEPMDYIKGPPHSIPKEPRNMWCTAPFLHAAGRKIYRIGENSYAAYQPIEAQRKGLTNREVEVYRFDNIKIESIEKAWDENSKREWTTIKSELNVPDSTMRIFRYVHPEYNLIMKSVLYNLYKNH